MPGALEGKSFPDRPYRICIEKVGEFIDATGDDPDRWARVAPPGFASALLFVVAPELLADPLVEGAVIHADQSFTWQAALPLEADLRVTGSVGRVRTRGDTTFVNFSLLATGPDGPLVEGRSTFLVGESGLDASDMVVSQLGVDDRAETGPISKDLPAPRSASRADLVRYAAATRDWNPIHWDHDTAVEAGLGGVVVHGLLQSAWLTQVAALAGRGDRPLESARFRYTAPLRPGRAARIEGSLEQDQVDLQLMADGRATVSGRFVIAA